MRMGRQHPPEANARSGCGGQGEPAGSPAQEVQGPAAAQLRRPGTRGAEGEEQSLRPGAAARWTHMAGGRRPPLLPGPGRTLNLLSPGRASKARKTVLPSSPRSLTAAEPWGPTRKSREGGGLREDARRRRQCSPRCPRLSGGGGGSGGALWPRAGRRGWRGGVDLPLAGEARTASSPLPPGPPLSLVPSPRARRDPERTRRRRGAARPAGTLRARGAGRGRGRRAPGAQPTPRAAFVAPSAPNHLPPSSQYDSFLREGGGGKRTEK